MHLFALNINANVSRNKNYILNLPRKLIKNNVNVFQFLDILSTNIVINSDLLDRCVHFMSEFMTHLFSLWNYISLFAIQGFFLVLINTHFILILLKSLKTITETAKSIHIATNTSHIKSRNPTLSTTFNFNKNHKCKELHFSRRPCHKKKSLAITSEMNFCRKQNSIPFVIHATLANCWLDALRHRITYRFLTMNDCLRLRGLLK